MGLYDNGNNKITGIDITNDHQYPFEFINIDVFELYENFFKEFDLIWASPPCQHYIPTNKWHGKYYPDLVARTRQLLEQTGKPYIIENVPGAPIRHDLMLCGEMFEGLRILRHRFFEFGGGFKKPLRLPHKKHKATFYNGNVLRSYYASLAGHGSASFSYRIEDWQKSIGIDWITKKKHLTQAIPPAYSNYIITGKVKHVKTLEEFLQI